MQYTKTTPCEECPFLTKMKRGFTLAKLRQHASGEFACHKTCEVDDEGTFAPQSKSVHCAGALIFLEKRDAPHQMMRIAERIGMYDRTKLDMEAKVR